MDRNKTAVALFNKLAKEYESKFMDVSLYHASFDLFCNSISKQAPSILEIACGPGNITKYLLSKRPDFNITGIDLAPNMLKLAKANNPAAEFEMMDAKEISKIQKTFDGVLCGFCLPYLSKEEAIKLIADVSGLLHAGGLFYLSTMEDAYSKSAFKKGSSGEEIFMHYHEAEYLTAALEENGFTILKLMRTEFMTQDGMDTDLLILSCLK
jgi:predicted TPR repeat methyltransferase